MRKVPIEEMNRLSVEEFQAASKRPLRVVLDNVRSMHNVGSVFRIADAFLLEKVHLCGITPTPPHREIRKTAIGAEQSVFWEHHAEIVPLLQQLKAEGYHLLAVEQTEPRTLLPDFQPDPTQKYAVILGHEITGVSDAALALVDTALEIPQFGTKHSLNVSVAAGIVLYALTSGKKQQGQPN
jgi:23S rRNA (guanosine2251-2'-O)-methyltransferase